MKKYLMLLLSVLFTIGCSTKKLIDKNEYTNAGDFVSYVNDNKTTINVDGEIISDKKFTLQIPNSLSENKIIISSYFLHELKFDKKQKIIIIYMPDKKFNIEKRLLDCSFEQFNNELYKLDVQFVLDEVKLIKNRRFGMILLDDNFFIMYLNIKEKNIDNFNYSVNNIDL